MKNRLLLIMTVIMAVLMALVSAAGIFIPGTYAKETANYAAQGTGQDIINLFVVFPFLLVSAFLMNRGSRLFAIIWAGIVVYTAYSYVIYSFGLHFNRFFLAYCAVLGISVYSVILFFTGKQVKGADKWFKPSVPVKIPAFYMFTVAALFYKVWLGEIIPANISGTTPQSIIDAGLMVNPVHVLDIAIVLPAVIMAGAMLLMKKPFGFIFAPAIMVFCVFMALAIAGMAVVMKSRGFEGAGGLVVMFSVLTAASAVIFILMVKELKKGK